ncbi:MAG: hypothetical protein IJL87_09090 [Clostridia bacterium]|nr:hypothetical protein [Clostridia bacterium]
MEIVKDKIEEIVEKIKGDKDVARSFNSDPVKTIESLIGVDLPDEAIKGIVEGVKAKLGDASKLGGLFDGIKNLFDKKD